MEWVYVSVCSAGGCMCGCVGGVGLCVWVRRWGGGGVVGGAGGWVGLLGECVVAGWGDRCGASMFHIGHRGLLFYRCTIHNTK